MRLLVKLRFATVFCLMIASGTVALANTDATSKPSYDAMLRAQTSTAAAQQAASQLIRPIHDDFYNADDERAFHAAEHVAVFGKRLAQSVAGLRAAYNDPHFSGLKIETCRQTADLSVAIRDGFSAAARAGDKRLLPEAFARIDRRLSAISSGLICANHGG